MIDEKLLKLLSVIKTIALVPYPFSAGSPIDGALSRMVARDAKVDPSLVLALGTIAGIADKAMRDYEAPKRTNYGAPVEPPPAQASPKEGG